MKRILVTTLIIVGLSGYACSPAQEGPKAVPESQDDAYETGVYAEARSEWEQEAEQGDPTAQRKLGMMYFLGQGIDPDYAQAYDWFTKAAAQGEDIAQLSLGVMYSEGQGVPKDPVRAHMWFSLSAQQGNPGAKTRLEKLAADMSSEQIAAATKLAEEWTPGS